MALGTVKWYREDKGYGFIIPDGGKDDVFVHARDLRATGLAKLANDQRVSFDAVPGKDSKPKAVNIRLGTL